MRSRLSRRARPFVRGWLVASGLCGSVGLWSFAREPGQPGLAAHAWAVAFLFVIFVATAAIWSVALPVQAIFVLGKR